MNTVRVGVQLQPQHCTLDELRAAWQAADALRVDSIWVWDHFFPLSGDPDGAHFEAWSLLAAMAVDTEHAKLGAIITRLPKLNPPPVGRMPVLIGASGEKVSLRIVAQYADAWNTYGTPEIYATKNAVLDQWCVKAGRDPGEIERTVLITLCQMCVARRTGTTRLAVPMSAEWLFSGPWTGTSGGMNSGSEGSRVVSWRSVSAVGERTPSRSSSPRAGHRFG